MTLMITSTLKTTMELLRINPITKEPCVFVPPAWRHTPLIDDLDDSVDVDDDNEDLFVF